MENSTVRLTRGGVVAAFALALSLGSLEAANRFRIDDATFPLGSAGNRVPIYGDADQDVWGFSVSLEFDRTKIRINDLDLGADAAAINPEWAFDGSEVDNTSGRLSAGVVFDLSGPTLTKFLPAGTNLELLVLTVDVIASSQTTTTLNLINVPAQGLDPIRWNLMSDAEGLRLTPEPTLDDGILTLVDLKPRIDSVLDNAGDPGKVFLVSGQNFNQPGLRVSVGGRDASFVLLGDNQTLQVTAPACDSAGFKPVQVCNDFGCDTETNGFNYSRCGPPSPLIQSLIDNQGTEGHMFLIGGQNFDQPGLAVRVGDVQLGAGQFTLLPDLQTIQATAPACSLAGWAEVEVCTTNGCDSEVNGFLYLECAGTGGLQMPADADQNGRIELTDGVQILSHLFRGTPARLPCGDGTIGDDANKDLLDMDGSRRIDLTDAVGIFRYLFSGGRPPPLCTTSECVECVPIEGCPDNPRC